MKKKKSTIKIIPLLLISIVILAACTISVPLPFKWANKMAVTELKKMVPGKWQIKSVRVSLLNGLVLKNVNGRPDLYGVETSVAVKKIAVKVELLPLIKRKIVPEQILISEPTLEIRTFGQTASLETVLTAISVVPASLAVPVANLKVENAFVKVDGGFPGSLISRFDDMNIERTPEGVVEGSLSSMKLVFGGNTILEKAKGTFNGNVKNGTISAEIKGRMLNGAFAVKANAENAKLESIKISVNEVELSKLKLIQGTIGGKLNGELNINGKSKRSRYGSGNLKVENMVVKGFSFQNEAHIEWLLPAIRTITLNNVDINLAFKNRQLEVEKLRGNGNGIKVDMTGYMSYAGMFQSNLTLFLDDNMVRDIPYVTTKALPKNGQGEYVIPASLEGPFPHLNVKVNLSLVTRAVGGMLKDVFNKLF
ncbi:MAG: hypothetical protein JNL74_09545 [Fibrobacteres bacterium]|nr:hypothetical protein [Fibrobacterota bacterium]